MYTEKMHHSRSRVVVHDANDRIAVLHALATERIAVDGVMVEKGELERKQSPIRLEPGQLGQLGLHGI